MSARRLGAPKRLLNAALAVLTLLALTLPPSAAVAQPGDSGALKGTVTDIDGTALEYASVVLYSFDGGQWNEEMRTETDASGEYVLAHVGTGTYRLGFFAEWGYRAEFWDDASDIASGDDVVVSADETETCDAVLDYERYGGIAGQVVESGTASPIRGVSVETYRQDPVLGDWYSVFFTETGLFGDWAVTGLVTGTYRVGYYDYQGRYLPEFYDDVTDIDGATDVTVAENHTTSGVDAALERASRITGTVTKAGGSPAADVEVTPWVYDPGSSEWEPYWMGVTYTGSTGAYAVGALQGGTYRVSFGASPYFGGNPAQLFVPEVYDDQPVGYADDVWDVVNTSGTDVPVAAHETTTGIDAELGAAGGIEGRLTGPSGEPVRTGAVIVWTTGGEQMGYADADPTDGTYRVGGLPAGDYKVNLYDYTDFYYVGEWYADKADFGSADAVSVSTGGFTSGIDAELASTGTWGGIHGTLTDDASGEPIHAMDVMLWAHDGFGGWQLMDVTSTDADGAWDVRPIDAGDYKVEFSDPGPMGMPAYASTLFGGGTDLATEGTLIELGAGDEYTADWTMTFETGSGAVAGTVTRDSDDAPLADCPVDFYGYDALMEEYLWAGGTMTGSSGGYIGGLAEGEYLVAFGPTYDYASEWYDDAASSASAATVTVTGGAVTSPIDASLADARHVSGTVRDRAGDPVADAIVSVLAPSTWGGWDSVGIGFTDDAGSYDIGGLSDGDYKVAFGSWTPEYAEVFWEQRYALSEADTLTVSSMDVSGVDATLTPAGWMTGAVTDESGHRVDGVHVTLWFDSPERGWDLIQSAYSSTGADMTFYVPSGDYRIRCEDPEGRYETVWYLDAESTGTASVVSLGAGDEFEFVQAMSAMSTAYETVAGSDRFGTAVEASKAGFPEDGSVETVVIATGLNWPDALGGASLAGSVGGPILLTTPSSLPASVTAEIERLGARRAIILGSPVAVGTAVENALKSMLGTTNVRRLQGADRVGTAIALADETVARLGGAYDGSAFLSTGANFPDALGASPLAAKGGWPIYLTTPAGALTPATLDSMDANGVNKVYVLGSDKAVPKAAFDQLVAEFGSGNVTRLEGTDRYDTAVQIAQFGVGNVYGLGWDGLAIATGQNFPDALAGGVLQGRRGSVLLLTPSNALAPTVGAKLAQQKTVITDVRYLGSQNAVSQTVRDAVAALLN